MLFSSTLKLHACRVRGENSAYSVHCDLCVFGKNGYPSHCVSPATILPIFLQRDVFFFSHDAKNMCRDEIMQIIKIKKIGTFEFQYRPRSNSRMTRGHFRSHWRFHRTPAFNRILPKSYDFETSNYSISTCAFRFFRWFPRNSKICFI